MTMQPRLWLLVLCALAPIAVHVSGHGRMLEPPSRSSAWRYGYRGTTPDYEDNEKYCGGFDTQYNVNGGKCGICGDPYNMDQPRDYERPDGKYVIKTENFILTNYTQGQIIDATIQITASHKGYFEFHLCPVDTLPEAVEATQSCLQENGVLIVNRYTPVDHSGLYRLQLQLPEKVTCNHCVLQWKYHTGNSYGINPDGSGCVGCGNQEEFYACADVRILPSAPSYIPAALKNEDLSPTDLEFFLCNFCQRNLWENNLPPFCEKYTSPRACPRR